MALPPAQFEPNIDQLAIPSDGGVPPSADNGPLEQDLAPVDESSRLANGRSDLESKDGNVPSNGQGLSPASSKQEPALGLSGLEARNEATSVGATPSGSSPPVMNGLLKQGSAPVDGSSGLNNGYFNKDVKDGKIASNVQDRSAASSEQGPVHGHSNSKDKTGAISVGAAPARTGTSSPVMNDLLDQGSAPINSSSGSLTAYPNPKSKTGNTLITNQATSPQSSPPIATASTASEPSTRSLDAHKNLKSSGNTLTTIQVASPVSPPPITNASSETPERSSDAPSTSLAPSSALSLPAKQQKPPKKSSKGSGSRKPQNPGPPRAFDHKGDFFKFIGDLRPGCKTFIKTLLLNELKFFENSELEVDVHADGEEYKLENLNKIHSFLNSKGLGLVAPADLSLKTVLKYIPPDAIIGVNYSSRPIGRQLFDLMVKNYLKLFNIPVEDRKDTINSITYEFSGTELDRQFQLPTFVVENGIIEQLNTILHEMPNKDEDVMNSIRMMPKYTKFLIISMAGSFTDIHFDFSGTSVYYHVFEGQKVFYVAPHNNENMENLNKFMRIEKNRVKRTESESKRKPQWIPSLMSDKWQRRVINAGETTFIPGGHLHFVYTPVDSLVIGGNFLMEKDIALSYKCTLHEEDMIDGYPENPTEHADDRARSHTFQGFRSTMWTYLEHMLLPRLRASIHDSELIAYGKMIVKGCHEKWPLGLKEWYPEEKKAVLLKELKKLLAKGVRKPKEKPTNSDGKEEEEIPGPSEEPLTSAASDYKRRQKRPGKNLMVVSEGEDMEDLSYNEGMFDADQPSASAASNPTRRGPTKKKPEIMDEAEAAEVPGTSEELSTSAASDCKRRQERPGKNQMVVSEGEDMEAYLSDSEGIVDPDQPSASNPEKREPRKKKPEIMDGEETVEILGASMEASTSASSGSKSQKRGPGKKTMKKDEENIVGESESSQDAAQGESSSTNLPSTASNSSLKRKSAVSRRSAHPSAPAVPKQTRKRMEKEESINQEGEGTPNQDPSTSSYQAPAPISRRKAAPKRPKGGNAMFAAVPEHDDPIDQLSPDPQADGEVRKIEEVKESQPRSGKALDPEGKKKSGAVEEDMAAVEEDEEEELREKDAAQAESSSTNLPSTSSASQSVKRKSAASRRSAKPSTSAVARQTRKRKEKEESMNQEDEETPSQEPSSSSLSAPAPISRRKAAPNSQKRGNAKFAAVSEHDDPIAQLLPDPQADGEVRKIKEVEGSQPHSVEALDPERKKKSGAVEEPMEIVEEDEEEVLRDDDATQAEFSSANIPSASSTARNVKRNRAAPRRSAKPSVSSVPKQTRKRKEKEESMNQEGEGTPSQEDSSHPAPAPISRRRRNLPHSSTSAGAPKRQKQGAPMNVADPEHDDPIEQLSPDSQAAVEGRKSRGTKGSQPLNGKALDPEKKKQESVEEQMEVVEENEEEVLGNEEEVLRKEAEANQPCSSSNIPYHTGDDDYDGGSRGGETVAFDSQEHSMDVDREEKDEVLGGEKEETSKESTQPASSSIIPCNNTTSAPDRLATSQEDESEVVVVPTTKEGKPTDKKDQQTSVVSDSKNKESIPDEEPSGVDGAGKNGVLEKEKKITPKENDTSPADSACIPSDNGNTVSASAVDCHQTLQKHVVADLKDSTIEECQRSSTGSNSKGKDLEPAPESVEEVRSVQEQVLENQMATRTEAPPSEGTPPATSLKRTANAQIKKEGEVPAKRARADQLKQRRLTPPRTRSPPPATTVGTYLQDLLSFLGKLHHQNPNLKEFIEIMGDLVRGCTMWKKKMSYLDIKCSMRRVFNSFKNNFFLVEINTEEMKVVKDEVNFELKTFLSSFKNFISTYETIPEGFGQLLTDIGDEIRDCEELEKGGEQKMLVIEEIIEKFSPDFDQFGLNRKYLAEIERRRASEGAGSSEAR